MSKKLTTEEFIERASKAHNNKYDYSKVEYINSETKVCIICPIHGEFWQLPFNHLNGQTCIKCKYEKLKSTFSLTFDNFIQKAKTIHGDKYDYSKVKYINNHTKVCIICPIHGEFWQIPSAHLNGSGCKKCGTILGHKKQAYTNETFIEKARQIHNNKYDYSKVKYVDSNTKVCIICPKHGEFWQRPADHLQGVGCEKCKESVLEKTTISELNKNGIEFLFQKRFKWLDRLSVDFYLPKYNIAIECQGIQHFKPINFGNMDNLLIDKKLKKQKERDKKKKQLCEEHGIKLYYINYNEKVEDKLKEILESYAKIYKES